MTVSGATQAFAALRRRRVKPMTPIKPVPRIAIEAGSGMTLGVTALGVMTRATDGLMLEPAAPVTALG